MDLDRSEHNQSITINNNSQENDSEITRLQAQLSKFENDLATLRTENERLKKVQTDYVDICKENDKLKAQLENEKNNKQTSHSEVFTDDANLKAQQLKELRKNLSTLHSDKEKLTNKLTESEKKLEKILAENKTLKDKISATSKNLDNYSVIQNENKAQLKQFEDKLKEKSYNQLATDIKVKNGEISEFQNKSNELEEIIQLQKKNDEYIKEMNDLKNLLQRKEKEKQELIEKNINLKKEASQYQSALGSITNHRMNDNDKNHSVQLKKDIEELQYKLKNYVTTLKGDFEIDFKEVNYLMEKYKIQTKVTPKEPNKPLVKAVLQHHIIRKITMDIRKYFKENLNLDPIMHLEKEIATKAKDLENKLTDFSNTRNGTDTITQAASIKIRQEVNIALGNRGFSDFLSGEDYVKHVYIIVKTAELNKEIEKYRKINDDTKKNYVKKLAEDLIREFIRIIHFRLKVQEPSARVRWAEIGSSIDPSIMEGNWDKDDIDNLEVEICSFPMIGRDLDDVAKRKIYTHAQVFTKRKKYPSYNVRSSQKIKGNLEPESDDDVSD